MEEAAREPVRSIAQQRRPGLDGSRALPAAGSVTVLNPEKLELVKESRVAV